jgi:hypothetical protein
MDLNPSAARSLGEGMEETLTVHRLHVLQLRKTLASTNVIESAFSIVERVCRNVKTLARRRPAGARNRFPDDERSVGFGVAGELQRPHGYAVRRTGGPGDEGVDLLIQKGGERIVVQCKAHDRDIGPGPVRDLYGSLLHHGADEAWLIASHAYTYRARDFASNKPISLLTIEAILKHPGDLL